MFEEEIGKILKEKKLRIATAESCTGGGLADRITNVSGSSDYFERGFVTYSVSAKKENLGVPEKIIEKFGVVSDETATAMAEGVKKVSRTDIGIGITGIAGPTGGSNEKPVGTVCIGVAGKKKIVKTFHFKGSRIEIKNKACDEALKMLKEYLVSLHNNDMLESKDSNYPQNEQRLLHEDVTINSHEDINDEKIWKNNCLSQVVANFPAGQTHKIVATRNATELPLAIPIILRNLHKQIPNILGKKPFVFFRKILAQVNP